MKNFLASQRFLVIYSGVLTIVFVVVVAAGFAAEQERTNFREITVQRINLVEPDGTLRMVISDKALFPGIFLKGKEHPHPNRKTAGMLFLNDEGTENGGLTFGGEKDKDGKTSSYGHLSFDAYEQDQVFTVDAQQEGDQSGSALTLVDRPNYPIGELIELTDRIKDFSPEQKKAEIAKFMQSHPAPHSRLYLGRGGDKSVALKLRDAEGRDRIVVEVSADGSPVMRFLDPDGKVINQLPPAPAK
ncbi:MAG TPA: hypothetical protein VMX38_20150 [Verrucomicrobiae bacterium]|nr:hypothetical protein [Verrucomicrobiae bacterium]